MFLVIGIAAIFSLMLAPALNSAPADAQKQNWSYEQTQSSHNLRDHVPDNHKRHLTRTL